MLEKIEVTFVGTGYDFKDKMKYPLTIEVTWDSRTMEVIWGNFIWFKLLAINPKIREGEKYKNS